MATKRAMVLGRRLADAQNELAIALERLPCELLPAWRIVLRLKRAAIAVGENRERLRRAKSGARP